MRKITISKSSTAIDACWWNKSMSIETAEELDLPYEVI